MSEDMSEIVQKMSDMLKSDQFPDSIKDILSNLNNNNDEKKDISSDDSTNSTESRSDTQNNSSLDFPDFDIKTMLKMKSIIDSMNKQQNDPRANLLRSLKPYLKPSRKEKVEQYIKIFSMGKMFEVLNPLGGEKNNDV